jgi:hypothetical protein
MALLLSEDLGEASAMYRIGYQGGTATLRRADDGAWMLETAGLNWIE